MKSFSIEDDTPNTFTPPGTKHEKDTPDPAAPAPVQAPVEVKPVPTFTKDPANDDGTPAGTDSFIKKPPATFHLKNAFGKAAALISLAGTLLFYSLGFTIGKAYYEQWQDNKAGVTQTWDQKNKTDDLPWLPAAGSLVLAFGAGAAGIAAGRSRKRDGYTYYGSSYGSYGPSYYNNDGFFWGYMLGSSNSRSSGGYSGGSKDNGGAAAALVIVAAGAIAVGASVVSYKALKANFGPN